jgi:hypothetical protein
MEITAVRGIMLVLIPVLTVGLAMVILRTYAESGSMSFSDRRTT